MASKSLKLWMLAFLSLIILLIAYWYQLFIEDNFNSRVELTLESLLRIEQKVSVNPKTKIAVGFGSCVDIVAASRDVIIDELRSNLVPKHYDVITTKDELLQSFAYFFQFGAASERFINNASLFEGLVYLANKAEDSKVMIGGNAPVMANRFVKEGIGEVLLGSQMTTTLKKLLREDITVTGPMLSKDDIHLLLEYPTGETWGKYTSPRANRFIVHNDHQNPLISSLETFHESVLTFKPDLLVIGGLQMMDNFPSPIEIRRERLINLRDSLFKLKASNTDMRIHFEMASFTELQLMENIISDILPFADSLGMNEQEATNLYNLQVYGNVSIVSDAYPRVALVLDQIRQLYNLLYTHSNGKLSRIHVHTLAFQAILTRKDSKWKNSLPSAAKAALTAHRHTCGSDVIDTEKARLIMDESFSTTNSQTRKRRINFNTNEPVVCWNEKAMVKASHHQISICVAPVLVCTRVIQTGGGGDNVSAAGLVLQV